MASGISTVLAVSGVDGSMVAFSDESRRSEDVTGFVVYGGHERWSAEEEVGGSWTAL